MSRNIYRKSRLTYSIWISLALFIVLFYSCPVKKFIQIHLGQVPNTTVPGSVYTQTNSVERMNIINRHADQPKIMLTAVQKQAGFDPSVLFLLSSLLAFLGLLNAEDDDGSPNRKLQLTRKRGLMPLYLQVHRLQV